MGPSTEPGFYVTPFGVDGEQAGLGFWATSKLSAEWLDVCSRFLATHGSSFDASWERELGHIQTKFTSASGTALVTFSLHGSIASSLLLLSGRFPASERSVAEMFIDSLKRTIWVRKAATSSHPYSRVTSVSERPLVIVVAWPEPGVSEQDHNLVRELSLHLAGVFFAENATP
jgi:hypothetical protein